MGVVDSIMVGHLGSAHLAASSLGNSLFFNIMFFGFGMTFAVSPLVAKAFGANDLQRVASILRAGVRVVTLFGVLLTGLTLAGASLIPALGQDDQVATLAVPYTRILALSVLPFLLFMTLKQFAEGVNALKVALVISLLANGFNALVNYVLIFGHFGFPALGLTGAGWATLMTRLLMAVLMGLVLLRSRFFLPYVQGFWPLKTDRSREWEIFRVGLPTGLQYFFEGGAFAISAFIIGILGKVPLAAHQIAMNLASITYMVSLGISMAASLRVANAWGRSNLGDIRRAGTSAFLSVFLCMSVTGLSFVLFHHTLPQWYIDDPQVIAVAAQLILIAALFQFSDGQQAVVLGVLRGLTDVQIPMRVTFFAYWVLGLPLGCLLAFGLDWGVLGLWCGFVIGLTSSAVLLTWRFRWLLHRLSREARG